MSVKHLTSHRYVERRGGLIRDQDIFGFGISIIAIMIRCPIPPDISCG